MRRRSTLTLSAILLTCAGSASAQGFDPAPEPGPALAPPPTSWGAGRGGETISTRAASTFDPALPAAITTVAVGGTFALGGATALEERDEPLEQCGLSGCLRYSDPNEQPSWGPALLVGGLTTSIGGASLFIASLVDPPRRPDAGRARVAAGAVPLSLGMGLTTMGITAAARGHDGSVPGTLIGMGAVTSAISLPFVAWGVATWDEADHDGGDDAYASNGRIVGGAVLTGVGVVGAGGAAAVLASTSDCTGELCGFGTLAALPLLGVAGAGLGIGLPLLAIGSQTVDGSSAIPELRAGPTSLDAKWRFQ